MVTKEFKATLADRCEGWEICEFLQISPEEFMDAFEEEIEVNYEDLAEWIGLRGGGEDNFDDEG